MAGNRKAIRSGGVCAFFALINIYAAVSLSAEIRVPSDYTTITEALTVAGDGDTIRVAAGTYLDPNEAFPLRLQKAVALVGDSASPGGRPHLKGDGKHTVVLIESGGVTLQGFRITDGSGSEGINSMDGGGICVFVGPGETREVNIVDCLIEDNTCPTDETYDGCGGGIYCGGTYCTCFETHISNCTIRKNTVHGQGGGIFSALLSTVRIQNTWIQENRADDQGGGVSVDVYAVLDMNDTHLILNNCPGDPLKPNWGGKGGGLACESFGVFTAKGCFFSENTAKYYGGGIFTRGGLFEGEDLCDGRSNFPAISGSRISKNSADGSGGGVYVAGSGVLKLLSTELYWNNAGQDGGAVFVAGGATGGGVVDCNEKCLFEGNEAKRYGGGVCLGTNTLCTFASTEFRGNSSLFDGGGLFLEEGSVGVLANCLIIYNNSARRHGGGFYAEAKAGLDLTHCSVVGNFASYQRSGLYLDPNAAANVRDSILWRNAGGSVESNGAAVTITFSLNEDGADPDGNVLCCDPGYVGWGSLDEIYVNSSASGPQTGTPAGPYKDLQSALMGFDFHLASDSPCVGSAGDGGNMGSNTGVGGITGNITAALNVLGGTYDIRGRNIIFISGIEGTDPNTSIVRHAVLGYIEDANIINLGITAEEIFGGITTRADVNFVDCNIIGNTALADGGGVFVADGNCVTTKTHVAANRSSGNGGGIYLSPNVSLDMTLSSVAQNTATNGAGCFASSGAITSITESNISGNTCSRYGGGLYLDVSSVSSLSYSQVSANSAPTLGGGIYTAGKLIVTDVNMVSNIVSYVGGGIESDRTGELTIMHSSFVSNRASSHGGGINSSGKLKIQDSYFESNVSTYGGAIHFWEEASGPSQIFNCQFRKNNAHEGGAIRLHSYLSPVFTNCEFVENTANYGGVGICYGATNTTFDHCRFKSNEANIRGGSLYLWSTGSRFLNCDFSNNKSLVQEGGTLYLNGMDASSFRDCYIDKSFAGTNGGAICLMETTQPVFSNVHIIACSAPNNGGGIAIYDTAKPKFTEVSISDCNAVCGGGAYAGGHSSSIFQQCEFRNNLAFSTTVSADGGGAFFTEDANGWFVRCVFQDNSATDDGGGLAAAGTAKMDLRNTLFAANTAINTGGGAYFTSDRMGTFTNCTIVLNTANGDNGGGGIYLDPRNTVNIDSSIIYGNKPDGIRRKANPTVNYSCVQETWSGTDNIVVDPLLDPNGFGLLDGSPCVDAGNPDPNMNDSSQPPGKGTLRNDMGITGGPDNFAYALSTDPNLVGWWTFEKIIGMWTLDSSGRGQHANLVSSPVSVPGRLGKALDFDGIDDYVEATIDVSEKTYAMSLWFNTTSKDAGIFSVVRGIRGEGGHDRHVYLRSGNLSARVWSNEVIGTTGVNYADGNWHCVVHTFGGEQKGQKLYVDGELKASGSKSFSDFYWQTAVGIGHSPDASQPYYKGQLDEVRIYDRSLSPMEVRRLVNP